MKSLSKLKSEMIQHAKKLNGKIIPCGRSKRIKSGFKKWKKKNLLAFLFNNKKTGSTHAVMADLNTMSIVDKVPGK